WGDPGYSHSGPWLLRVHARRPGWDHPVHRRRGVEGNGEHRFLGTDRPGVGNNGTRARSRMAGTRSHQGVAVKQYLLGIQQPDSEPPPPEVLAPVMRDLAALTQEM